MIVDTPSRVRATTGSALHQGSSSHNARTAGFAATPWGGPKLDLSPFSDGIVGFKLTEEPGDAEAPAPAKTAPAKTTGRKAKAQPAS